MSGIVYIFSTIALLILIIFIIMVICRNIKSYKRTGNKAYLFLSIMNIIFTMALTAFTIANLLK